MAIEADHHVDVHEGSLEQRVFEFIAHCGLHAKANLSDGASGMQ